MRKQRTVVEVVAAGADEVEEITVAVEDLPVADDEDDAEAEVTVEVAAEAVDEVTGTEDVEEAPDEVAVCTRIFRSATSSVIRETMECTYLQMAQE